MYIEPKIYLRAAVAAAAVACMPAHAALTLTADGEAKGFELNLFLDQVPASGYCCGPVGVATNRSGQVVVQDYPKGRNYVYTNVNNQHFNAAVSSAPYATFSYAAALTNAGGTLYATNNDSGGRIYRLKPDGSIDAPVTAPGAGGHGIWTNFATGHLVATTGSTINDIDPVTGSFTTIVRGVDVDGVSVSSDGKTIYGASAGHVYGWNYAGTLTYDSGYLGSPDGIGVIQGNNPFAGNIVANDNAGRVWLLDPLAHTSLVIASGGSRGDYVGVDSTDGSLFLTQTDSIYRLSCGADCGFTPTVPEPSNALLLLAGAGGLLGRSLIRRKR